MTTFFAPPAPLSQLSFDPMIVIHKQQQQQQQLQITVGQTKIEIATWECKFIGCGCDPVYQCPMASRDENRNSQESVRMGWDEKSVNRSELLTLTELPLHLNSVSGRQKQFNLSVLLSWHNYCSFIGAHRDMIMATDCCCQWSASASSTSSGQCKTLLFAI